MYLYRDFQIFKLLKKLLLLLLLTASFSTFALSEEERAPCSSPDEVESAKVSVEVERKALEEAIEREIAEFEAELGDQPIIDEFPINEIYLERKALEVKRKALQDKHNAIFVKFRESKKSRDFLNTRYIYQLYRESNARIKTLDAAINYIKRDIKSLESKHSNYFKTSNYYKYHSMYMCKQSPEGLSLDESGKVVENGIRVGKWTWYNKYNRIIKQGNYVNGIKEGKWFEDYSIGYYVNDKKNNTWNKYTWSSFRNDNGTMKLDLPNDGTSLAYNTDLLATYNYNFGIKDGLFTTFVASSSTFQAKLSEGRYKNDKKDGTWTYWNREGQIQKEEVYEDGVLIEK